MKIVFVIGNIGSGKSSVCGMLAKQLDGQVLSLDGLGHQIFEQSDVQQQLHATFGEFNTRKELAKVAFSSPENTAKLNSITHPKIYEAFLSEVNKARRANTNYLIVEETAVTGADDKFLQHADITICCTSDKVRNPNPKRKDVQLDTDLLINMADFEIKNNATLEELSKACNICAQQIIDKVNG